ncbi:MAG: ABC transporter substrate-binding protein [Pseudomonadota bacterium]
MIERAKFRRFFFLAVSLAAAACSGTGQSRKTAPPAILRDEIVVGAVTSLTGSEANYGASARNGYAMAAERINAAGGVNEKKIRIDVADDTGTTEGSVNAVTRLIHGEHAVAILGADSSSHSIAMAAVAQAAKIPMITPSATNPRVTEVGDYIFRVCFIDPFQGAVMARFAREDLKVKRVAILRAAKNEYSVGLADFFKEKFASLGGRVVTDQSYGETDRDFIKQLSRIQMVKPDLIYVPGYYTDAGLIVRQARAMRIPGIFAGGDGWDAEPLFDVGGDALEGSYFTNHYSPEGEEPRLKAFVAEYRQKWHATPDSGVALAYDAAMVLFEAMKRAKSLSGPDLKDAITRTKDFPGVTGVITINAKRNAEKPAVILKIEGRKAKYLKTVAP